MACAGLGCRPNGNWSSTARSSSPQWLSTKPSAGAQQEAEMARLEGKTAVITGAADGIGHAIAQAMAREGAHVFLSDISDAQGERCAWELGRAGHFAGYQHCDVAKGDDIGRLVDPRVRQTGHLGNAN